MSLIRDVVTVYCDHNLKLTHMKKLSVFGVLAMLLTLSSCQIIGDIFKAGVWAGVLMVVVVVGLVIFVLAKIFGGGK